MGGQRHRGQHRRHVDGDRRSVESKRRGGGQAGDSSDEMNREEDALAAIAIAHDGDEGGDQRARHHAGEEHESDRFRAVGFVGDHAQRHERGPLRRVEAAPRELCPAQRAIRT